MTTQAERALQSEVVLRLRAWPVVTLPIPNGIWVPARSEGERALVVRIINRMKSDGMLVPGAPDLAIFWNGGAGMIELKRPPAQSLLGKSRAGVPTEAQVTMAERAAALKINHAFCQSWDDVAARLTEWGAA